MTVSSALTGRERIFLYLSKGEKQMAESKKTTRDFFLDSAAVLADTFAKLGINGAVNEMFEALLRDMGIPYTFPYKQWTDFLKPPVKEEAERLCRVSDVLENQDNLMKYCIDNELVDPEKVDENYRLNEPQYISERLNFFLSKVKSLVTFPNLASVLGANSDGQPLRGRVASMLWQGIVDRYLPTDEQLESALRARFVANEPERAATLCFWRATPSTLCTLVAQRLDSASLARLATRLISNAKRWVTPAREQPVEPKPGPLGQLLQ